MIDELPVSIAVANLLATVSGMKVGRGARPPGAEPPYYLLDTISTTLSGAPLADENEDLSVVYQVTAVSGPATSAPGSYGTADQTKWMADKARRAFLARDPVTGKWLHTLTISGARVMGRSLDIEPGGSSDPADAIISNVQRFRFDLTPA
ncbi:hypothetical protein ACFWV1_25925 [Streptomyces sp. NPDC058700]|uniref:hypothetical protein n=1 Tax=Streptomyces sp. NPDC058700 TaxID=3346607 RepID=UPI0036527EC2